MKAKLVIALFALCAVAGCSAARPPSSVRSEVRSSDSTQALPGGGMRATAARPGLSFAAEVASTTVQRGSNIVVRFLLTNTGTTPIHWDQLGFGCTAGVTSGQRGGISVGIDVVSRDPGATYVPFPSVTIKPGESTSTVISVAATQLGTYRLQADYGGGGPSGKAPDIVVGVER